MCVCMCTCVYVCKYIYVCVSVCMLMCLCVWYMSVSVYWCVCVCTCTYVYLCVYAGVSVYAVYVGVSVFLCVCICLCVCVYVYVCMCICVCMLVCLRMRYVCVSVCVSICLCVCVYVCVCMCICVCMLVCLCVYIDICVSTWMYVCVYAPRLCVACVSPLLRRSFQTPDEGSLGTLALGCGRRRKRASNGGNVFIIWGSRSCVPNSISHFLSLLLLTLTGSFRLLKCHFLSFYFWWVDPSYYDGEHQMKWKLCHQWLGRNSGGSLKNIYFALTGLLWESPFLTSLPKTAPSLPLCYPASLFSIHCHRLVFGSWFDCVLRVSAHLKVSPTLRMWVLQGSPVPRGAVLAPPGTLKAIPTLLQGHAFGIAGITEGREVLATHGPSSLRLLW